ncbi:MAG: PepSY domain-containing protein [Armatimonadota bacterium]|nr:PepSY domain-containing protein [Armatimonadota bacterium]MDR7568776.1 PepSY domain-containing protein [Armatimonadota bacterium]
MTLDAAAELVQRVLADWGYRDLVPKEVMEFTNHFYVLVVEKDTGKGAMELIVERNRFVHPEPGPNMMWNTKYGHMAGMMGPASGIWLGAPTLSRERAREIAREFLGRVYPGAEPDHGTEFYGYFTFDVERDGRSFGMLSVNAYTGQVWVHTWHGAFIQEKEL